MDSQLWGMVVKIVIFLPFVVFLIYLVLKYGGTSLQKVHNGRFIKIVERVPISKDNNIMVIKMGSKSYVVTSTVHSIEILKELEDDEEIELMESKVVPQFNGIKDIYDKLKRKGR